MTPRLEARDLRVRLPNGIVAVDGVSSRVDAGQHLALVGETGSGKSTLLRALAGLLPAEATRTGEIRIEGASMPPEDGPAWVEARRALIGFVFQEARAALNPVQTALAQVAEAVDPARSAPRADRRARAAARLDAVGFPADAHRAYPHELSGGLAQRVMLAMALARDPGLVLADEPVAQLDPPRRAEVRAALRDRVAAGAALVEVTHDLDAIEDADAVMVMYAARLVEIGPADRVRTAPRHPYTAGLLAARPRPGRPPVPISGTVPSLEDPPPGCRFHPRCGRASDRCRAEAPILAPVADGHRVACYHPLDPR